MAIALPRRVPAAALPGPTGPARLTYSFIYVLVRAGDPGEVVARPAGRRDCQVERRWTGISRHAAIEIIYR
jgi:hypothetical protein